jgi:diacylglycerol kinase family enzyme
VEFVALARTVADGDHVYDPRVRYLQAESVVIDLEPEAWINTDGEVLRARRCAYAVRPRAATFLAGAAPFAFMAAAPSLEAPTDDRSQ